LMPVPLVQLLQDRGVGFVEVPEGEFASMACNVLAIAPRTCVAVDGNPITRQRMEAAGCTVLIYQGENISRFGEGGPTCLTRPLRRV
ncbi:MAG: arginine deiminase family protein, partial [Pseudomonadota bacterium]